jgi:hypothetical protein
MSATSTRALNTQHIKGLVALKAGSQPPPHWYLVGPLLFTYNTDTVKESDGSTLPIHASITSVAWAGGVSRVTTKTIFGGFYGFAILFPAFINNRLQGTEIDQNPGGGLTDSGVTPISLGWHFPRMDLLTAYNIFVPTGRYADGASDNLGFGMWGHEVQLGTTAYLDASRTYHAATIASFDFQSEKEGSETRVGNTLILEGGIGRDFLMGGLTAGMAYYSATKLSSDHIEGFPGILVRGKNKTFALGPEVTLAIASGGSLRGFVKVNYHGRFTRGPPRREGSFR